MNSLRVNASALERFYDLQKLLRNYENFDRFHKCFGFGSGPCAVNNPETVTDCFFLRAVRGILEGSKSYPAR